MKTTRFIILALILLTGCASGIREFWNDVDIAVDESNYGEAEDRFAEFAELTATSSPRDASAALDKLFNRLRSDEVSYYVYSDWMVSAFHSLLSPARNPGLFARAVKRFASDGIMTQGELEPLQELAAKDMNNLPGSACDLPELKDAEGNPAPWSPGSETVFAVVNLDCATCVSALHALRDEPGRHVALCYGITPPPVVPGWEYRYSPFMDSVFDLDAAPFWFAVDAAGKVRTPYSPIPHREFATPEQI